MNLPKSIDPLDPVQRYERRRSTKLWAVILTVLFLTVLFLFWRLLGEVPTDFTDNREHFKYGSIGSEEHLGIPYWIWQVLPEVFSKHLPNPGKFAGLPEVQRTSLAGYAQFGFVVEAGADVPIGFSKRRIAVDRVGLNCAVCHVGTVEIAPGMDPRMIYGVDPSVIHNPRSDHVVIPGMPSHTVNLSRYIQFLIACGDDPDYSVDRILEAINSRTHLGPIDKLLYRRAIPEVQEGFRRLKKQLAFVEHNPSAGPGRIDTFNPYKNQLFGFPVDGTIGTADFPSLWNQRPREGMQLHWDGNNKSVFERNISASFGAGATSVSLDFPRMLRVATWIGSPDPHRELSLSEIDEARAHPWPRQGELPVPRYPFPIDEAKSRAGAAIYDVKCARCHDWRGSEIGKVIPLPYIGTDPQRLDSFTEGLVANQNTLGAGEWWRFRHFRKTNGYVNMPLDGLWARAPYLHNGSVPTLRDLLEPKDKRPANFYRGDDAYDPVRVGFRGGREISDDGRDLFKFDTSLPGNSRAGHEGEEYGTTLSNEEKSNLVEYLKTL